jgi:hypothetical protein
MALITINNPVGINVGIGKLQAFLFNRLVTKWGISGDDYSSYGLVYRNKKDNQYIAEAFTGVRNEYKEVYWDDTKAAVSWFGISGASTFDKVNKTSVHLVFFVNLKKLKPLIAHRADEEVRIDVQKLIGSFSFGFSYEGSELWIENVLREYPGSRRDNRLGAVDMHPIHCFRINLTCLYSPNIC